MVNKKSPIVCVPFIINQTPAAGGDHCHGPQRTAHSGGSVGNPFRPSLAPNHHCVSPGGDRKREYYFLEGMTFPAETVITIGTWSNSQSQLKPRVQDCVRLIFGVYYVSFLPSLQLASSPVWQRHVSNATCGTCRCCIHTHTQNM